VLPRMEVKPLTLLPAPVVALGAAMPLGAYFGLDHGHAYNLFGHVHQLGPQYLLSLPASLGDVITFPDFSAIGTTTSLKYVGMFTLVGSLESTLSILAVDALDPAKRASDPDRDLLSVGIGNLVSASLGGLPMISEIVRSKANIDAGAKSGWSNFFHGAFLLAFVVALPELLRQIPLAALGAMLVYTGARLASPREVMSARALGSDQLVLFLTTLFVTLAVDLLVGVLVGVLLKVGLHWARTGSLAALFRARIESRREGDRLVVSVHGPATFLVLGRLRAALEAMDGETRVVVLDLTRATLVDHTFLERLHGMASEWRNAELETFCGARLKPASEHPMASRSLARSPEAHV
jgi:MFS superfamily sulfate permease-like transporter